MEALFFSKRVAVRPGDKMRRRRIISCESRESSRVEKSFTFCTVVLKLCLCEALYLPAFRATCDRPPEGRIQRKA